MAQPIRWPEVFHDLALAKEVIPWMPEKPADWDKIADRLSEAFSTDQKVVELKGRGCRERMDRLLEKFEKEDAKSFKRQACFHVLNFCGK